MGVSVVQDGTTQPHVVYLDMNVWVAMARGLVGHEPAWQQVRSRMGDLVRRGLVVFPLSAAHYLELWHRRDNRSREQVGSLMRDLSRYWTLLPAHAVRADEVSQTVDGFFADPPPSPSRPVLGHGATHAFASPYGRFRFVESLASVDGSVPEGQAVPAPDNWPAGDCAGLSWEWLQLVGTEEILASEGVDRAPEHRKGTENVRRELALRARVAANGEVRARLWDLLVADEIVALWPEIERATAIHGRSPLDLFLGAVIADGPPDAMRVFLESIPSAAVWCRLRYAKHQDLTHPWEQHDWTDLAALSVAIPYSDAVITERRWAHVARAMRVDSQHGTLVGSGLEGLLLALDRAPS